MENDQKTFAHHFDSCCIGSLGNLAEKRNQNSREYEAALSECDALYSEIEQKLGADYKLINKFDAAKCHLICMDDKSIYQQGFQDCIYLLRWMGVLL